MFQCTYSDLVFIQGETKNQNNYADNAEVIITEVARKIIQSNHIDPFELRLGLIGTHYPQDNADGEVCYYSFMSNVSQFQSPSPTDLIWSLSACGGHGTVVRLAAIEAQMIRLWLRTALEPLKSVIGIDVFEKAFI